MWMILLLLLLEMSLGEIRREIKEFIKDISGIRELYSIIYVIFYSEYLLYFFKKMTSDRVLLNSFKNLRAKYVSRYVLVFDIR
jgi:hypothetical protein